MFINFLRNCSFPKIHVRHIGSAILNFRNLMTGLHSVISKTHFMTIQWLEKFVPQRVKQEILKSMDWYRRNP